MRVLFISSFLLFADSRSGAAKRLYYFARALGAESTLSLVCLDAGQEADHFSTALSPSKEFLQVRYERGLLDKFRDPFDVPAYLSPEMKSQLDAFIRASNFDVVFCAFAFALSLLDLPSLGGAKRVVYLEDDLSFEVFRERMKNAHQPLRKLHMAARWWQAEAFYRRLLPRVTGFVAISEEEAEVIRRKFPHLKVTIAGYGIPLDEYPKLEPPVRRSTLGFIGNYIHQSNRDAVQFFLDAWYPVIKKQQPGITILIAGKRLPESFIRAWKGDNSIVFRDNVPDLRDFYSDISILINPIVSQRGLRTKLVEAAAFGRPIISTTLGAEGLERLQLQIVDSANDCVKATAMLQDNAEYERVAEQNRLAVQRYYSIDTIGRTLIQCLQTAAES